MKLKDTDALLEKTGETVEYLKLYAQQQVDIVKLDAVEKSAKIVSSLITNLVMAIIGFIAIILLAVTGALFLGQLWNNYGLGFLVVTLTFLLIGALVYFFRTNLITNPVISHFIGIAYEEEGAS